MSLKQLTPNKKIPLGLLAQGPDAIRRGNHYKRLQLPSKFIFLISLVFSSSIETAISGFDEAKRADSPNEVLPGTKPATRAERRRSRRYSRTSRISSRRSSIQGLLAKTTRSNSELQIFIADEAADGKEKDGTEGGLGVDEKNDDAWKKVGTM